jgi:hypothetical protein
LRETGGSSGDGDVGLVVAGGGGHVLCMVIK